jgi:hypothetical protein
MEKDKREYFKILAKELHFLFPDKKVVSIERINLDVSPPQIEGRIGKGFFTLDINIEDIEKILRPKVPVVSSPKEPEEKPTKNILKIEEQKEVAIKKVEVKQPEFTPPTDILSVDRHRMSKPGETELFNSFISTYPDPYKGRKKLSLDEKNAKEKRDRDILVAKSYILSGNRKPIELWVDQLKKQTIPKI